ncbi:MAG TPA: protein translocase subunit SecF [Acidimicrobiales bacterium]|nr:protein translocase subunit SecF [Acidimicrobiales bacterium]
MSNRSGRNGPRGNGAKGNGAKGNGAAKAAPADAVEPEAVEPEAEAPEDAVVPEPSDADVATGETSADDAGATPAGGRGKARRPGAPVARTTVKSSIWTRLYHGETNIDFVGRRKLWFTISLILVAVSLISLATRGLELGIDFKGGAVWEVPSGGASVADARSTLDKFGLGADATIQEVSGDAGPRLRIETDSVGEKTADQVTRSLAKMAGTSASSVDRDEVGPSWGKEISKKAVRALIVFLILVTIYIAFRFELKMAIPTLVALVHDVIVTVGVYSVTRLEVTPATVIAVLTILGYSIYDGIVVFDKVDENTRLVSSTGGLSYGGMVNVSLNQTLMRSLNTTMTALLPVLSLLIVGSWIMGASVLEEFALALLIGLFSGAYSSIFIASPLLAVLKEREPRYRDLRRRIEARGGDAEVVAATIAHRPTTTPTGRTPVPAGATAGKGGTAAGAGSARQGATMSPSGRAIPPRPRKKTKGRR